MGYYADEWAIKSQKETIMKKIIALMLLTCSFQANAGFVATYDWIGNGTKSVNNGYVGLKWTLDEGVKPQAVVGFRHASIDSKGDTDGGDVSISAKFIDGFQLAKLRAKYFNGKESAQGEIGGGYDFTKGLFAGLGIRAPYSVLGADLHSFINDRKFEPYFQIDTNKRYNKPNKICSQISQGPYSNDTCTSGPF